MLASLIDGTPIEPSITCKLLGVHRWLAEDDLEIFGIQIYLCCHTYVGDS